MARDVGEKYLETQNTESHQNPKGSPRTSQWKFSVLF